MMKRLSCISLLGLLGACQWIGDTADNLGDHMPVIGPRCEHWQCITESGRNRSEGNKTPEQREQEATLPPMEKPVPTPPPYPGQPSSPTAP